MNERLFAQPFSFFFTQISVITLLTATTTVAVAAAALSVREKSGLRGEIASEDPFHHLPPLVTGDIVGIVMVDGHSDR